MPTMTTFTRGAAALSTAALLSLGFATTASADHIPPPTGSDANQASNWVDYVEAHDFMDVECFDVTVGWDPEEVTFTADQDYALVVLKNATYNDEFWEVWEGETIETDVHGDEPQHAVSHVIGCTAAMEEVPEEPENPEEPEGPIVETDIVESSSNTPALLGGAAVLAGLGLAGAAMRRKGQI